MNEADATRISPTAHYTGYVWWKNGLGVPELWSNEGLLMFYGLEPVSRTYELLSGEPTLEHMLIGRHTCIDFLLERAFAEDGIGQVLEIACGLSPRGCRFTDRYPELRYIEADLPDMAARKRNAIGARLSERHQVVDIDVLVESGPLQLAAVIDAECDPAKPTVVITEGLINYFQRESVLDIWRRLFERLGRFPAGRYLSDMMLDERVDASGPAQAFRAILEMVTRGSRREGFRDGPDVQQVCRDLGAAEASVYSPSELAPRMKNDPGRVNDLVSILEVKVAGGKENKA